MSLKKLPKKLSALLLTLALSMNALQPSIAKASECTAVVQACDKTLADQDKVINLKTRQIEVQKDIIAAQDVRVTQLEKEKGGLLRSPWFYFAIGVVAGGLIMKGR